MKNISRTMDKADAREGGQPNESDISIVERIVRKTGNRKLAAILALDLFLVGVDTVSKTFQFLPTKGGVDHLWHIFSVFLFFCFSVLFLLHYN